MLLSARTRSRPTSSPSPTSRGGCGWTSRPWPSWPSRASCPDAASGASGASRATQCWTGSRVDSLRRVAHERDLFANFERMRREMDELFDRRLAPQRRGGFSPAVDVYYTDDPPRAVVRADLAGIDPSEIELQIRGRELILAGQRKPEC